MTTDSTALDAIREAVGDRGWTTNADDIAPHLVEPRGLYRGAAAMLVRPTTTEQVARVVQLASEAGIAVVPQGGSTRPYPSRARFLSAAAWPALASTRARPAQTT